MKIKGRAMVYYYAEDVLLTKEVEFLMPMRLTREPVVDFKDRVVAKVLNRLISPIRANVASIDWKSDMYHGSYIPNRALEVS